METNDNIFDARKSKDLTYLEGPPFNPKDYMISPVSSETTTLGEKPSESPLRILPRDMKMKGLIVEPQAALRSLSKLINDKFAVKCIARQGDLLATFIKGTPPGFLMEDIPIIIPIVKHFFLNMEEIGEYISYLKLMLSTVECPPRLAKTTDLLHSQKELTDYFTMYGELLIVLRGPTTQPGTATARIPAELQLRILEILNNLISKRIPPDMDCVKLSFCHAAMERSKLPSALAFLLKDWHSSLYQYYLELALQIIPVSVVACTTLIEEKALNDVIMSLTDARPWTFSGQGSDSSLWSHIPLDGVFDSDTVGHVAWALLYAITDFKVTAPAPSIITLKTLRRSFRSCVASKKPENVHARNNLAALIIKMVSVFGERAPIVQSGLVKDIAMLAVATEIGTKNTWARAVNFTTSDEDFELKNIMLLGCTFLTHERGTIRVLRDQKVVEGILHLINPNLTDLTRPWSASQFTHLLFVALRLLSEIAQALPDVYVSSKGTTRLLLLLEWCLEDHFDKKPLLEAIKTLCSAVSCSDNSQIVQDMREQYGMKTIFKVCQHVLKVPALNREHHAVLARAFMILEILLKNEKQFSASCGDECIGLAKTFLQRLVEKSKNDSKTDPRMVVCFGGFLWEVIIWNPNLINRFNDCGGVYLILDLIEMSSHPVQVVFLGVLVDMSDEGNTIAHLLTWRGRNGFGLMTLLIDIWIYEERMSKVHRSEEGCILDVEKPLMTEEQWFLTGHVKNAHMYSPAVAELVGSARPKIHAIYQLLKQRYFDKTEISEDRYCLYLKSIKPPKQVYVPLIEHFLALKIGEVWYEVLNGIDTTGILPSAFDGHMLCTLMDHRNKWSSRVKLMQEEILLFQKMDETKRERSLYEFLRSCRLAPALDALHELDYLGRTSFKVFQREKKARQRREIGNLSNLSHLPESSVHRTFIANNDVTHMAGNYVWFKSEKRAALESEVIGMVSQSASKENVF